MRFAGARRADPILDITPMIDIVFQLVLFFMVSTTFINAPGLQVDLPRSSSQVVISDARDVSIWMTCGTKAADGSCSEGAVYVEDKPVSAAALSDIFKRAAARDPDTLVVLKADVGVRHGQVVAVMDLARSHGLTRLAIATEVPEGGGL
ncbi:MAG: biopolymer transporter ExbD [Deltaproteobacteria bacterium]|nr:biopolymer transporter ExbD [Deltaproteobacteria bacterium]